MFSDHSKGINDTVVSVSWNVSAVNMNPFEYWVTHPDPEYNKLMAGIQSFVDDPENDVPVAHIFTDVHFSELCTEMKAQGIKVSVALETKWKDDIRIRFAIKEFLRDYKIGMKRLISMPDRITNTIYSADGRTYRRPSAISSYDLCSLDSLESWWCQWKEFMFNTPVEIFSGKNRKCVPQKICALIGPILRSKYPAITAEEQAISIPLQILCLAILDAILIFLLNTVAPSGSWQGVKRSLCEALIHNKQAKTCDIIASYSDAHVIFLQEAAAAFVERLRSHNALRHQYHVLAPHNIDGRRDQNSLILIDRRRFCHDTAVEVTARVLDLVGGDWVAPGDLLAVSVQDVRGQHWLLASFHGDSNGLSARPVLAAIHEWAQSHRATASQSDCQARQSNVDKNNMNVDSVPKTNEGSVGHVLHHGGIGPASGDDCGVERGRGCAAEAQEHVLLVGLDANTHSRVSTAPAASNGLQQGVADFYRFVRSLGLLASWEALSLTGQNTPSFAESGPNLTDSDAAAALLAGLADLTTTCNARTLLQAQPGKAVGYAERSSRRNLRDWILAYRHQVRSPSSAVSASGKAAATLTASTTPIFSAGRDNTGRRRYVEEVFPTLDFPSDHALISATFSLRLSAGGGIGLNGDSQYGSLVSGGCESNLDQTVASVSSAGTWGCTPSIDRVEPFDDLFEVSATSASATATAERRREGVGAEAKHVAWSAATQFVPSPIAVVAAAAERIAGAVGFRQHGRSARSGSVFLQSWKCGAGRSDATEGEGGNWDNGAASEEEGDKRAGRSLYDYWGISEAPLAQSRWEKPQPQRVSSQGSGGSSQLTASDADETGESVRALCERHYFQLCTNLRGDDLDGKRKILSRTEDWSIWIVFSTRPFSTGMYKLWFRTLVGFVAFLYLTNSILNLLPYLDPYTHDTTFAGRYFRFTPVQLRKGPLRWITNAGVDSLGLLRAGCKTARGARSNSSDSSMILWFPSSREKVNATIEGDLGIMDGFWFRTAWTLPVENDPLLFRVEHSMDGIRWDPVVYPPWARRAALEDVPYARGALKRVDLQPSWDWIAHHTLGAVNALAAFCACVLGAAGRGREATLTVGSGFLLACCGDLAIASCLLAMALNDEVNGGAKLIALFYWLRGIANGAVAAGCWVERYLIDVFVLAAGLCAVTTAAEAYCDRIDFAWNLPTRYVFLDAGVLIAFATGLVLALMRRFAHNYVLRIVIREDKAQYDKVWSRLLLQDEEEKVRQHITCGGALQRLEIITERIATRLPRGDILQRLRPHELVENTSGPKSAAASFLNFLGSKHLKHKLHKQKIAPSQDEPNFGQPIASLEQLFSQARCVDLFLKQKVKGWALVANGSLWVRDEITGASCLRKWDRSCADEANCRVLWTRLKPHARALEKLVRSYECNPSQLLDCCRQTIYFDSLDDLAACLETVSLEEDVQILRIKNRFDKLYDPYWSAGYRSVLLNLRIRSEETARLGVDNHVCELQLALKSFTDNLNNERHKRYLIWRNCRGAFSLPHLVITTLSSVIYRCPFSLFLGTGQRQRNLTRTSAEESLAVDLQCIKVDNGKQLDSNSGDMHHIATVSGGAQIRDIQPQLSGSLGFIDGTDNDRHLESFETDKRRMIEEQFRLSMTRFLPFGLYRDKLVSDAVLQADSGSLWDTSHPFAAALCKPWFRHLSLFLVFSTIWQLTAGAMTLRANNRVSGQHFKFTALEARGDSTSSRLMAGPGIAAFGVTNDRCDEGTYEQTFNLSVINASMILSLSEAVPLNGWWFTTAGPANGSLQSDPIRFRLEMAIGDKMEEWRAIGSSTNIWTWAGALYLTDGYYSTPLGRGERVYFDLQLLWPFCLLQAGLPTLVLVMTATLDLAVFSNNHMRGKYIVGSLYLLCSILDAVAAAGYYDLGQDALAFVTVAVGLCTVLMAILLVGAEHLLGYWCGILGALYVAIFIYYYLVLIQISEAMIGHNGTGLALNSVVSAGLGQMSVTAHALIRGRFSRTRARRIVAKDWIAYQACWAAIVASDANDCLHKIKQLTDRVSEGLACPVLQRNRPARAVIERNEACDARNTLQGESISGDSLLAFASAEKTTESAGLQSAPGRPVDCLDQLFAQAHGLDLFLRQKAQQWAIASGGCLPVVEGHVRAEVKPGRPAVVFERWDAEAQRAKAGCIRWPGVKSRRRAVEKLYRSNGLDVARLLDCCRASVYFYQLSELLQCLECVIGDADVRLARIKNRLDPEYDAVSTAGFRNVCVNLSIATPETASLGLDLHICEVQLVLVDFAKLATEEGHERYKIWRNYRAQ